MKVVKLIRPFTDRPLAFRLALSVGIFAIAFAARFALLPVNGTVAFATFYPETVVAFYLCGMGPGIVAVVLSAAAGFFIFSTPDAGWAFEWQGIVAVSGYLLSATLIGILVRVLQDSFSKLRVTMLKLRETSKDYQDLYDHAPCGYHSLDANGRYSQINDVALSWLECEREEVIGLLGPADFFSTESKAIFAEAFPRFRAEGHIGPIEFDLIGRKGTRRRVTVSATAVQDPHCSFIKSRSVMYDISELHEARQRLERLNKEQLAMLDNKLVGIVKLRGRRAVWKNRALESIFGYLPGELDNLPSRVLYRDDESYRAMGEAAYPVLARGDSFRTQALMARKGGEPIWIDMSGVQLSKEPDESMWLMIDITQMKQHQAQVEMMALHDPLTGLANRLSLSNLLHQTILRCEHGRECFAVCFVDLNGFKPINDQFGHDVGDLVLKTVATRLREVVRGADTVARLGGDEFVLVLTSLLSPEHHQIIVDRVVAAIAQPIRISDDRSVQISASVGTAFYPEDGTQPEALLLHADQAMYRAKRESQGALRKRVVR